VTRPDGGLQYRPDLDGAAGRLQYQPNSAHITCVPGERVLVRLANLGFQEQSLSLPGIPMTIVGSDARHLAIDTSSVVDTVDLGPGESRDVIITAPDRQGSYPFFNRDMGKYPGVDGDAWSGGQRTEVLVKASVAGHPQPADQPNFWSPSWL
jgi:FtsP/CotA-like multicopper oxidase with cupredoxin domain